MCLSNLQIEQGVGKIMSAYEKILHNETNRTSDSGDDCMATREMDQLIIEALVACRIYSEDVKMITAEKASAICHCGRRKIYHWIEEGDLRFFETPAGEAMV